MTVKIMFFTTGMTAGGAERVIATLANELDARGFAVSIGMIKGRVSAYQLAPGVRLVSANLEPGVKNFGRALAFYRRLLREVGPHTVISFSTKSDIVALIGKLLFTRHPRLVVSERLDPYTRRGPMQAVCNRLYALTDALVCQSESVATYYRHQCPKASIHVVRNPLNVETVGESIDSQRTRTVLVVGRLARQKNHGLAIRCFASLHKRFPDLSMRIYGEGSLRGELEELIAQEGISGIVRLEGIAPNVIRANSSAALFLFTSDHEGYPNALLEAAAAGIPVVTTDFSPGTAKDIIVSGVNGYIVSIGDQEALEDAAIRVLEGSLDPRKLESGARGIRERHELGPVVDEWVAILQQKET